jgi:hypothetical protein
MIIGCMLFSWMENICHRASFCNPRNQLAHRQTSDGFVDDVMRWFNLGLSCGLLHNVLVQDIASGHERERTIMGKISLDLWRQTRTLQTFGLHAVLHV